MKTKSQTWTARVRAVYSSLAELVAYDSTYSIARRCGPRSPSALWKANPVIGGSVNPRDFGRAR